VERAVRDVVRHVWVISPPEAAGRWPGVLLEWRRDSVGAWEARVLYAVGPPAARPSISVERWLAADEIAPT
jgi:hypothetical protein